MGSKSNEVSDVESLIDLQHSLIETRKVFPPTIKRLYKIARATHTKYLLNNSLEPEKLPEIPDELLEYCHKFEEAGDDVLEELKEQIRMLVILIDKKNCMYSKVIDAL